MSTLAELHHLSLDGPSGSRRLAYWQWGRSDNPHVVVCVHGLTRQGRDFDVLAQALCAHVRVLAVDVPGRGQSDGYQDPKAYQIPNYVADFCALLPTLGAKTLDWVGTSMGGLIGITMAGQTELQKAFPLRRLVLNDVGPAMEYAALQRIGQYVGQPLRFDSWEQGADYLWAISKSFGTHTREQWLAFSRPMFKPLGAQWVLHYDPAIAAGFRELTPEQAKAGETVLWALYDQIQAKTLLLRGADSDLLSRETAQAMCQRGPCAQLCEFTAVGHAPTLIDAHQVQVVCDFLSQP